MDVKNYYIYFLDSAGNFLKFLIRDEGDRRYFLFLVFSGDILWVGGYNGYFSVYKYINNLWFIFKLLVYINWIKNKLLMKLLLGILFKIKLWKCFFFIFLKFVVLIWFNKIKERKEYFYKNDLIMFSYYRMLGIFFIWSLK